MNILFLTDDSKAADAFKEEMAASAPSVRVEVSPDARGAAKRLGAAEDRDILVLDSCVPNEEALKLVSFLRKDKKPTGIVALVAAEKDPPAELLKSGVDQFVVKRPGYLASLPEIFQQLKNRRQTDTAPPRRQVRLLYAGDFDSARRHLSGVPQIKLEPVQFSPEGSLLPPEAAAASAEAIILESAVTGTSTLKAVKESIRKMPEVPVILIADPGDDETAIHAIRAGAADCITKSSNYHHRLLLALQREVAHRELIRERTLLRSREERLRHIVERMPASVAVIAPDGVFLAVNDAGLKLIGAARLDQIVGKNIAELMHKKNGERMLGFLNSVCRGAGASIRMKWKTLDGTGLDTEFRAVPIRRDGSGAAALVVLYSDAESPNDRGAEKELEQAAKDYEAKIRAFQEKETEQKATWEEALTESESRRIAAEEQQARLKSAADEAESRRQALLEEQQAEREKWEQAQKGLHEQYLKIEAVAQSLKSEQAGLLETHEARKAQWDSQRLELEQKQQAAGQKIEELTETLQKERSEWEVLRQELEQKRRAAEENRASLDAALRSAESRQTDELASMLSEKDLIRAELEQKLQAAEEQCAAIQEVLQEEQSRNAQALEQHSAELAQRELACRESEDKRQAAEQQALEIREALQDEQSRFARVTEQHSAELARRALVLEELEQKLKAAEKQRAELGSALNKAESRISELGEKQGAEISQYDSAHRELEQKWQSAEEQILALKTALHDAETGLAQAEEERQAEISRRDLALKELELKYQAAENQKTALQNALREAESSLAQITEKHSAELSQRSFAQKKAEQKYQAAENQRMALEEGRRDVESNLARMTETYEAERAQWDRKRQDLEQKIQEAEAKQAIAMQNAVRETESRLAWISEQNQAKAEQLEEMQQQMEQLKADYERAIAASSDFHLRNQRFARFTSMGVILARRDGSVVECNDAAARMFGYSGAEEAISHAGQNQFRIYAFEGALNERLQQDGKLENIEWSSLMRDGRLVRVQENAMLVETPTEDSPLVERILVDVSNIHKLSEEVRRARRMESTGDLAAATVKSLKELCASLAHSGEILVKSSEDVEAVRQVAESLMSVANRGVKHARQFLSVASKSDRTPSLLNLNEILKSNDRLLRSLTGEDIDLQTVFAPGIGLVSADRNDMVQLIGSLLASSRESLPIGGAIMIETTNVEIDNLTAGTPAGLKSGIYVQMAFNADGCAVQPEKRSGSNRALAERMGGRLEFANDPKLGNIFRVYFPRVESCTGQPVQLQNAADA